MSDPNQPLEKTLEELAEQMERGRLRQLAEQPKIRVPAVARQIQEPTKPQYQKPLKVTRIIEPTPKNPFYKQRWFKPTLKVLGGIALVVTSLYIFKSAKHSEEEGIRRLRNEYTSETSKPYVQPYTQKETPVTNQGYAVHENSIIDWSKATQPERSQSTVEPTKPSPREEPKKSSEVEIRNVQTRSYSSSPVLYANESFKVYANRSSWQSTNINVNNGDTIDFSASGSVVHWQSADKRQSKSCGPDGRGGQGIGPTYLVSGLNDMGLVGKIGSYTFNIGSSSRIVAQDSGVLSFGINDTNRYGGCADNSGNWTVKVKAYRK